MLKTWSPIGGRPRLRGSWFLPRNPCRPMQALNMLLRLKCLPLYLSSSDSRYVKTI